MAEKKKHALLEDEPKGKEPEPAKNVEAPKAEGGAKPSPRDAGADMATRHSEQRAAVMKAHENERRDLHGNHREEHRKMHTRHEQAHKQLAAQQTLEMNQGPAQGAPDA